MQLDQTYGTKWVDTFNEDEKSSEWLRVLLCRDGLFLPSDQNDPCEIMATIDNETSSMPFLKAIGTFGLKRTTHVHCQDEDCGATYIRDVVHRNYITVKKVTGVNSTLQQLVDNPEGHEELFHCSNCQKMSAKHNIVFSELHEDIIVAVEVNENGTGLIIPSVKLELPKGVYYELKSVVERVGPNHYVSYLYTQEMKSWIVIDDLKEPQHQMKFIKSGPMYGRLFFLQKCLHHYEPEGIYIYIMIFHMI